MYRQQPPAEQEEKKTYQMDENVKKIHNTRFELLYATQCDVWS